ncbi:gliding motility protein GldM [Salegentibacter sp. F188]|uniref:Gliding motility protein GldM n=1 Tax=Autumnicola patrickiae TaxID=3075591 RepID=A0ABU3E631_9FLAO|nr:gliding motility protein GldM [Salegentibacter sp. F188]MDT0691444.1 gliding motility protein GldM [Salegentibacter sp. F188]
MASGKQTPRQKMINLMYLVFIAMMALNMSKEVLTAFGLMNEKLSESNELTAQRNNTFMAGLEEKVSEQPEKYEPLKAKAERIDSLSSSLDSYIQEIKNELIAEMDDPQNYEAMDQSARLDEMFFQSGRISPRGQEFVERIDTYRESVAEIIGDDYSNIAEKVRNDFATEPENVEGANVDWLKYKFEGFPLVASLTQMTQIQSDIKTTENQILAAMLSGQLQSEVSMTNYSTILETPKSAYYQGEEFNGAIVLGRTDPTTRPNRVELTLDGRELDESDYTIDGGRVVLNVPAGNAGQHKLEGQLIFMQEGEEVPVGVSSEFSVIPKPNAAVISADKMNVVYRGVQNPLTISMAGVPDNNVSASAPGLSRVSGSNYVMDVTTLQAREVTINVTGTIDGESYPSSKDFRVKDIPRPVGTIRGEDGAVSMQRNSLEIATIGAALPDFDFALDLNVTGFSFKVPGQPTIRINGSRLDDRAKSALRRAGRGESVQIFDIQASLAGNSGYKLKKVAPVVIELTN